MTIALQERTRPTSAPAHCYASLTPADGMSLLVPALADGAERFTALVPWRLISPWRSETFRAIPPECTQEDAPTWRWRASGVDNTKIEHETRAALRERFDGVRWALASPAFSLWRFDRLFDDGSVAC